MHHIAGAPGPERGANVTTSAKSHLETGPQLTFVRVKERRHLQEHHSS